MSPVSSSTNDHEGDKPSPLGCSVFYSYSHKDESIRDELENHLSLLRRQGAISVWHDRKITPGNEWAEAIDSNITRADIILLLVSSDFIASEYCYGKEMNIALERHLRSSARVIPVILRSVDWHPAPFGKLQALPTDGKPVSTWEDKDEALTDITRGIRLVVEELEATTQPDAQEDELRQIIERFLLRPGKHRGTDLSMTIDITGPAKSVSPSTAQALGLSLGDAIYRDIKYEGSDYRLDELYATRGLADWLESVDNGRYSVDVRLLYGDYSDITWTEDGPIKEKTQVLGILLTSVGESVVQEPHTL